MGPRDWLPPTSIYAQDWRRRPQRSILLDDRCPSGRSPLLLAVVSLLFGGVALVCAVAPWFPVVTGVRWVLTTVGVSAVLTGAQALRRRRGWVSLLITALSTLGIGTGVIATAAMAATFVGATGMGLQGSLPSSGEAGLSDAPGQHGAAPQPPAPAPVAAVPSIGQMEQTVGTLALQMRQGRDPGMRWPATLQVSEEGVVTAPGIAGVAVRLPTGTQLGYRTSTDGSAFAVRLSRISDPASYVDYDTNSGVVTAARNANS